MKKSVRKKGWFKRISAVIMAVALILSGISIPDGLFAVKAKAAENSSASWSMSDKMYKEGDSENTVSELNKAKGTLVNSNNDELILDATSAKITNRNQDFQVNTDLVLTFPLVENARTCTITIQSYNELTNDNIEIAGMSDYVFTTDTTTSYKSYIIKGVVNKGVTEVSVKLKLNTYFNSIKIDSSTSTATTSAAFSADKLSGFETGKTISAEWNYSNGTISDSGSNTQIYNKTGKYTNKDGDVLYIDASKENGAAFKLDSSYSRIQLNKGVEINVPVVGDKAVITLLLSKNYTGTTTEDILTDSMISINDNSNLLYKKCTSNEKYDDNYRKIEITCYLSGAEGEITVISNVAKNYLQSLSIQCEELEKTSIKGTITSASAIPDGTSVVAVNKTTGLQYSGIISDNMYSVEVPVEDEEMEYELSISNPAYIITNGITSVKLRK